MDTTTIVMIGIVFASLMVFAYIIWHIRDTLMTGGARPAYINANNLTNRQFNNSIANVTSGFDSGVNLLIIAITIFILALAIGALLMLRGRR